MKITNNDKQVGNPDAFDGGTCGLAVSNECFATGKKLVRTKTDDRAPATGGTQ